MAVVRYFVPEAPLPARRAPSLGKRFRPSESAFGVYGYAVLVHRTQPQNHV